MPWHDGLTGRALEIARSTNTPIRVMAGPGTGKSFALKRRLTRLLEEGADPSRMLVVTFTRNGAADLIQEISQIGVEGCESIVASTLHSYCFRLLTRQAVFDFTGRHPRPLVTVKKAGVLQFEAAPLLEDLNSPETFGDKRDRTKRIRAFEANWARLQSDEPGWALEPADVEFERALDAWLRFHECMLIGELVPESLKFLRNNPASDACDAFDHVLVDEYQDLNKAEQVLIDILAASGNYGIVGDEDQSIYSFRFAHPDGIVEFHGAHPGTDDHVLDECRRCPKRVVAIADHLIRKNHPPGAPTRLQVRPSNPDGEIEVVQWTTMEEEAAGVAAYVRHLVDDRGFVPGDILILSPRRMIGYAIRDELAPHVPTHSFYHEESLEGDEAQESFALLALAANPRDRVSLRFLLGFGSNTWLSKQYAVIRSHCEATGAHPWDVLAELEAGTLTLHRTANIRAKFRDIKTRLAGFVGLDTASLINALFPDGFEWARGLREAALLADPDATAEDLLDHLRTRITQPEMPEEGAFVRIMSLHKSKGLTSRAVIVCGCIEGLIPYRNDDETIEEQQRHLAEQRRLFYVVITRCTEILMLSSFRTIPGAAAFKIGAKVAGRGRVVSTIASRFLGELGPTCPAAISGADAKLRW
jgi:DNA helicase-2/ATP-dependent DNA helicase PcrA